MSSSCLEGCIWLLCSKALAIVPDPAGARSTFSGCVVSVMRPTPSACSLVRKWSPRHIHGTWNSSGVGSASFLPSSASMILTDGVSSAKLRMAEMPCCCSRSLNCSVIAIDGADLSIHGESPTSFCTSVHSFSAVGVGTVYLKAIVPAAVGSDSVMRACVSVSFSPRERYCKLLTDSFYLTHPSLVQP